MPTRSRTVAGAVTGGGGTWADAETARAKTAAARMQTTEGEFNVRPSWIGISFPFLRKPPLEEEVHGPFHGDADEPFFAGPAVAPQELLPLLLQLRQVLARGVGVEAGDTLEPRLGRNRSGGRHRGGGADSI